MIKKTKKKTWFASILWANDYLRQCLLFNGRVLVSIRHRTSGSHLPSSPPCNQKHWNWALHRIKCGRNISLESTDFRERLWQGGGWCDSKKAKSHRVPNWPVIFNNELSNMLGGRVSNSGLHHSAGEKHSWEQHIPWLWQNIYMKESSNYSTLQVERNKVMLTKLKKWNIFIVFTPHRRPNIWNTLINRLVSVAEFFLLKYTQSSEK